MPAIAAAPAGPHRDRLRQALNLACAFGQVGTTVLIVALGADKITGDDPNAITPLVPAGYTFAVWGVIYAGSLAYAVYQALPRHREDELLRRSGPFTAAAFLGTSLWLIAAQRGWSWSTRLPPAAATAPATYVTADHYAKRDGPVRETDLHKTRRESPCNR